jgi:NTP pyrophosphatase (non-canonical NTP hydrolase)
MPKTVKSKSGAVPISLIDFQTAATQTDHTGSDPQDGTLVSVLGIVGEAGDLATLFKKKLRDGDGYTVYPEQCAEELGDILWYVATLCTKLGLSLDDVAKNNLVKTKSRWIKFASSNGRRPFLDDGFPVEEQIPRNFVIKFTEVKEGSRNKIYLTREGKPCGDSLTDNAYSEDGYRYHDIFHLAYAAVLGWSPITRMLLNCKRRSIKKIDEIEDGGRAAVIEEAISALVFQYAEQHSKLDNIGRIDSGLLSLIMGLTNGFEVSAASAGEWEDAILLGYKFFRILEREKGGLITVDLINRKMSFQKDVKNKK